MVRPQLKRYPCTIGVFAPSGAVNPAKLAAGVRTLQSLGHTVKLAPEVEAQWRYFAGEDEVRLASFQRMLADPEVDIMAMARGGYGWSRILHLVDWAAVLASGKLFMGFSDFTAFQLAALAKANLVTYAGPGVATDFDWTPAEEAVEADRAYANEHCWPALTGRPVETGWIGHAYAYPGLSVTGPLWGSNLSIVSHLAGTPYMPQVEGGILFIEEIDEQPYAVERMFLQLFHAGILARQKALVLGAFTNCEPDNNARFPYTMEHVVESLRKWLPYPVLTGLPFGHVARKLTLPFGAPATLTVEAGHYSLAY